MSEKVEITSMSYGPWAVGRQSSGKTVFVLGGVPGRVCEVDITKQTKKLDFANSLDVDVASLRLGASWSHLDYDTQLSFKEKNVKDALTRTGKFDSDYISSVFSGVISNKKKQKHYRNKLEFAYSNFEVGMTAEGSDEFISVSSSELGCEMIADAPKALRGALKFASHNRDLGIYRIGVRGSLETRSLEIALWTEGCAFPRAEVASILGDAMPATSIVRVIANNDSARKVKQIETLMGYGFWRENLEDMKYGVSAPSFFQVNTWGALQMQRTVLEFLRCGADISVKDSSKQRPRVADLYCGGGTFTLPLLKSGLDVVGVELSRSAIRDLRSNLKHNDLECEVICDDVCRVLPDLGELDAIVVDPPRSGLDRKVIDQICSCERPASAIVYVSCDPQTLSRDLKIFCENGYALGKVQPIDLFPQTYHVETVALLTR